MKLDPNTPKEMDLGFEIPPAGTYRWQIQEGIELRTNESSGKTTLQIPISIDEVIDGDPTAQDMKCSHFVPIETTFGEKQLAVILSLTGLIGDFNKRYGDDVDVKDEKFVAGLKLKLPGKFFIATHTVRKNNKDQDQVNFVHFGAPKKGKGKGKTESPTIAPAAAAGDKSAEAGW
ncbi:MAG: hypothetical protein KKD18_03115 [Nanoarchaeota archaeon]|nr:hypothetical protein [Nanoarchaeota archaeon]